MRDLLKRELAACGLSFRAWGLGMFRVKGASVLPIIFGKVRRVQSSSGACGLNPLTHNPEVPKRKELQPEIRDVADLGIRRATRWIFLGTERRLPKWFEIEAQAENTAIP